MNVRVMIASPVAVLALGFGLLVALWDQSVTLARDKPPARSNGDEQEKRVRQLIGPADPKAAGLAARELAKEVMPSPEQLREHGQWKLPWEFTNPRAGALVSGLDLATNYTLGLGVAEDRYWNNLGENAAFVGLTEEQGKKALEGLLARLRSAAASAGVSERQLLATLVVMPTKWHASNPTVAVAHDRAQQLLARMLERSRALGEKKLSEEGAFRFNMESGASLFAGLTDQDLKAEALRAFTLNQRHTRLVFFRTNKWEELLRIKKEQYDVKQMAKDEIWYSLALVNLRLVAPAALERLKDLTAEDANRLQAQWTATVKATIESERPLYERDLRSLEASIERSRKAGATPTYLLESKRLREQAWEVNSAAFPTVRLLNYGENSYVISNRSAFDWGEVGTRHTASIRNGVAFAEIEIYSTFPKEESNKDLEFFLKVMHDNTVKYRGSVQ